MGRIILRGRVSAAFYLAMSLLVPLQAVSPSQNPVQRVRDISELMPKTSDEIARAKLFDRDGEPIQPGAIQSLIIEAPPIPPPINVTRSQKAQSESYLHARACGSAMVLAGHITYRRAFLTTSKSALFTDYTVVTDRSIKPDAAPPSVLVSALGGSVEVGGLVTELRTVTMPDSTPGIFFLDRIPKQAGYETRGAPIFISNAPNISEAKQAFDALVAEALTAVKDCQ